MDHHGNEDKKLWSEGGRRNPKQRQSRRRAGGSAICAIETRVTAGADGTANNGLRRNPPSLLAMGENLTAQTGVDLSVSL